MDCTDHTMDEIDDDTEKSLGDMKILERSLPNAGEKNSKGA